MDDEGFCKCNVPLLLLGLSIAVKPTIMLILSSRSFSKVISLWEDKGQMGLELKEILWQSLRNAAPQMPARTGPCQTGSSSCRQYRVVVKILGGLAWSPNSRVC